MVNIPVLPRGLFHSRWLFGISSIKSPNPIEKNMRKSNQIISSIFGVKIKHVWNRHLGILQPIGKMTTHHSPLLNHFWISWDPVYSTGHLLASKSRTSCTWQSEAMRRLRKLDDFHHISCPVCPVNARILKGTLSLEIMFIYKSKT